MADIFISYARADRRKVRRFAEALEKKGWQVWWDLRIRSGSSFDRVIEQALEEARCVIVIWSRNSVESDWVRAEAGDGLERRILVSIAIDQELRLPLRFRNVHTDLLLDLAVDRAPSVFNKIVADIETLTSRPKPEGALAKAEAKRKTEVSEPEQTLKEPKKTFTNSIGAEFVLIPAGSFMMGSSSTVRYLLFFTDRREKPTHEVKILQSFYLQTTQITQGQWKKVMGDNPSGFKDCGADCPVESVSWDDVQKFIRKLNDMEGIDKYRLPSEAEWEYGCRAGTTTEFFFGDDAGQLGEYAWYKDNSEGKTHPVGQKGRNAWGLYDMHGNVWEWVEDDWHGNYDKAPSDGRPWVEKPRGPHRVIRGGSWGNGAHNCRSATRDDNAPDVCNTYIGFRLARSVALGS
jgi:formylglycine-generating enzyme required for sulfatase activity